MYEPTAAVLTAYASVMIDPVMSPSYLSSAVAPSSTYGEPTSMVWGLAPTRVMTGGVMSGTVTTIVAENSEVEPYTGPADTSVAVAVMMSSAKPENECVSPTPGLTTTADS